MQQNEIELGQFIVARGWLTKKQLQEHWRDSHNSHLGLVDGLVARGVIDSYQAIAIKRQFLEYKELRQVQEMQATIISLPEPQHWQRYQLQQQIASQGSKRLYKAYDRELQRFIALKLLTSNDPIPKERLRREALFMAKLNHPYIVKVHDSGEKNTTRYFTMDFIEGSTLDQYWKARSLDFITIAKLMTKIATTINYVHTQNIIHRDLKPANIMIDQNEEPIIIDFGLAKLDELPTQEYHKLSQAGETIGTLHYMSPEQAEGDSDLVDYRSDVYSLGAILYEILTGASGFRR